MGQLRNNSAWFQLCKLYNKKRHEGFKSQKYQLTLSYIV